MEPAMNTRVSRFAACAMLLAMGAGLTAGGLSMSGCQSGGLGDLMNKSAMEMLTPMVKDAANSYLANIKSLTSALANVRDMPTALSFVQEAEPKIKQLSSAYNTLSGTTGEERSNLFKAFGSQFESANTNFLSQSNRVNSNGMLGQAAASALNKVSLFKR